MNIKRGVQAFSKAEQSSSLKGDEFNALSALDQQKHFGDQDLGTVLNKIADPNWVDPGKKVRAAGNDKLDKDAFFKLMLAQLKHQDPTNPMQSHEMAAQLAQFSSVEQLTNMNQVLEGMAKQSQPDQSFQALALIGKKVSGDTSKVTRLKGDNEHEFNFALAQDAQKITVSIKNNANQVIRVIDMGNLKKGDNNVTWNGLKDDGAPAPVGDYKFSVEAKASNGSKVSARTEFSGRITGLNFSPSGPVLLVGTQQIKLNDVKRIEEPTIDDMPLLPPGIPLKSQGAAKPNGMIPVKQPTATSQPLSPVALAQPEVPGAPELEAQPVGNIQDVPMSRELQTQLEKMTRV